MNKKKIWNKARSMNTERRLRDNKPPFKFDTQGQVIEATPWAIRQARRGLKRDGKKQRMVGDSKKRVVDYAQACFDKYGVVRATYAWFLRQSRKDAGGMRDKAYSEFRDAEDAYKDTASQAPGHYAASRLQEMEAKKGKVPFAPEQNLGVLLAKQGVIGSV